MSQLRFDPLTSRLFTADGQLIKKLECPWSITSVIKEENSLWHCQNCHKNLTPAWEHSGEELLQMIQQDSEICLILDPHHEELELIFDHGTI